MLTQHRHFEPFQAATTLALELLRWTWGLRADHPLTGERLPATALGSWLSQRTLARSAGCAPATAQQVLAGKCEPRLQLFFRLVAGGGGDLAQYLPVFLALQDVLRPATPLGELDCPGEPDPLAVLLPMVELEADPLAAAGRLLKGRGSGSLAWIARNPEQPQPRDLTVEVERVEVKRLASLAGISRAQVYRLKSRHPALPAATLPAVSWSAYLRFAVAAGMSFRELHALYQPVAQEVAARRAQIDPEIRRRRGVVRELRLWVPLADLLTKKRS